MNNKLIKFFNLAGLTWFVPIVKICAGDNPTQQIRQMWLIIGVPIVAFIIFLSLWSASASRINTSLGAIPGPSAVWHEFGGLLDEHTAERQKEKEFYQQQLQENQEALTKDPKAEVNTFVYTGKSTYLDQIFTSLYTVFTGFILATLLAV
ncbi:MAG: ABC transporter permease, partial [Methylococcaceae bacterium]|nr:ABC transporter permease [Methylococcaceae bacterium]